MPAFPRAGLSLSVCLALFFALAACAPADARGHPAPTACRAGQKTLRLEPLDIVTASGLQHFSVEIADTDMTREIGLMCRASVPPGGGMLFDFGSVQPVAFWMRNTIVPLDMLFIGADGRIVNIARNARPLDETPIPASGPVLAVLELRGGRAAELGLRPGDQVRQRIFSR